MNGNNNIFRRDPFNYATQAPINLINMRPADMRAGQAAIRAAMGLMDVQKKGVFDLSPEVVSNRQNVFLRPKLGGVIQGGDAPLQAYWCPYKPPGTQGSALMNVPHVDLPKNNPQYDFMFTGAMNGCSLVILNLQGKIRVYHDSLHDQHTFANQAPLLRLDYCQAYFNSPYFYYPNANNGGQSCNFLYFNRSVVPARWTVVCQPQSSVGAGDMEGRSPMALNNNIAPFQVPVPY